MGSFPSDSTQLDTSYVILLHERICYLSTQSALHCNPKYTSNWSSSLFGQKAGYWPSFFFPSAFEFPFSLSCFLISVFLLLFFCSFMISIVCDPFSFLLLLYASRSVYFLLLSVFSFPSSVQFFILLPVFCKLLFFLFQYWFSARVLLVLCHATNRSHTLGIVLERLVDRVCWTKSQSSFLSIYFSLKGIYSTLLLIHFPYCSNTCLHCHKDWHTTYSIYDDSLSRMRHSVAPLVKHLHLHLLVSRNYVQLSRQH